MTKATVLAVANRKGGVGKTTTAVTLAHGLARRLQADGRQNGSGYVLLIDLDPQGSAGVCLGVKPKNGDIGDVLMGESDVRDVVMPTGEHRPGLFLLPATDNLADAKSDLVGLSAVAQLSKREGTRKKGNIDQVLNERLGLIKQVFRYIVIDCPPSLDVFSDAVYNFADSAVVPVKTDFLAAKGARQHTNNIIEAQTEGIKIYIEVVVPTFFRKREVLPKEVLASLIKFYGPSKVCNPIPQASDLERAPAVGGQTIWEYAPDSAAAMAYKELVDRVYKG